MARAPSATWSYAEIGRAFALYDANRSGKLDYRELRAALRGMGATAEDADGSVWLDVTALGRHRGARRANRGGESSSPMTRGATEATGTSARGAILGLLTTPRTRAGGRRARVKRSE